MSNSLKTGPKLSEVTETSMNAVSRWHTSEKRWFGVAVKILNPVMTGTQAKMSVYTRNFFSRFVNYFYKLLGGKNDNFLAKKCEITVDKVLVHNLGMAVLACNAQFVEKKVWITDRSVRDIANSVFHTPESKPTIPTDSPPHSVIIVIPTPPPISIPKPVPPEPSSPKPEPEPIKPPIITPNTMTVTQSAQVLFDECSQKLIQQVQEFEENTLEIPAAKTYSNQMKEIISEQQEVFKEFLEATHEVPDEERSGKLVKKKIADLTEEQAMYMPFIYSLIQLIDAAEGALDEHLSAYNDVCEAFNSLEGAKESFKNRFDGLKRCRPYQVIFNEKFEAVAKDLEVADVWDDAAFESPEEMGRFATRLGERAEKFNKVVKAYDESHIISYLEQLQAVDKVLHPTYEVMAKLGSIATGIFNNLFPDDETGLKGISKMTVPVEKEVPQLSEKGIAELRTRFIEEEQLGIKEFHEDEMERFNAFAANALVKNYVNEKAVASVKRQLEQNLSELDQLKETYVVKGFYGFSNQSKKVDELTVTELAAWKEEIKSKKQQFWDAERERCPFEFIISDIEDFDSLSASKGAKGQDEALKALDMDVVSLWKEIRKRIQVLERSSG